MMLFQALLYMLGKTQSEDGLRPVNTRASVGIGCALLAPFTLLPLTAALLAFGPRSDPDGPVPTAVLVSNPTGTPCVMFCDEPPRTSDSPMPTADPATLCPPFCEFERW